MNDLTLCLPYYMNPGMLQRQYTALGALAADLKTHLRLIVVDDGSPTDPATAPAAPIGVPVSIYRIGVDVPWNQDAARNLAAQQATTPWLVLTDIDHLVTAAAFKRLIRGPLSRKVIYRFARRLDAPHLTPKTKNGMPHPHPNSWVMTRAVFDAIGGYDEALAGNYGTDGDFARRAARVARLSMLDEALIRVPREVVPDASTTTLERKNPEEKARIKASINARGEGWRPLRGSFPWTRVA